MSEAVENQPTYEELTAKLADFNSVAESIGMARMEVVSPKWCRPRAVNARYMDQQTMDQLVENIKSDGRLESIPLCMPACSPTDDEESDHPWFETLSGHHRIEGAEKAGLEWIVIMVTEPDSQSHATAKQISHNSISGADDSAVLKKMFESLEDIHTQMYSGLVSEVESISIAPLSVRQQPFEEFVVMFINEDIENFDECMESVEEYAAASTGTTVRLAPKPAYDHFAKAIRQVKKCENIKSNATAIGMMVDLAMERLDQLNAVRKEEKAAEDKMKEEEKLAKKSKK